MPEIVTKYPEVVLQVLKGAGVKCGVGAKQTILKACPHDQFCSMPSGELCVYGVKDIGAMTQMTAVDVCAAGLFNSLSLILFVLVFGIGLVIGMRLGKSK